MFYILGDKFVLKAAADSRRQFLIISGKVVLAFVSNAAGKKKFTDCATITDVTPSLTCKVTTCSSQIMYTRK